MTALTADRPFTSSGQPRGEAQPVAAGVRIYMGALTNLNAAGYIVPASDAAGETFAGISVKHYDNTLGADGDILADIRTGWTIEVENSDLVESDNGKACAILDDQTIQKVASSANPVRCGIFRGNDEDTGKARLQLIAAVASADS